jgi:hypothetical protein
VVEMRDGEIVADTRRAPVPAGRAGG